MLEFAPVFEYLKEFATHFLMSYRTTALVSGLIFVGLLIIHISITGVKSPELKNLDGQIFRNPPIITLPGALANFCYFVSFALGIVFILGISSYRSVTFYDLTKLYRAALTAYLPLKLLFSALTVKDALFNKHDLSWFAVLGYNLKRKKVFAVENKLSAGEKLYFWLTLIIGIPYAVSGIKIIKTLTALPSDASLIGLIEVHFVLYLSLAVLTFFFYFNQNFVHPGSLGWHFHGMVSREWATTYRPKWFKDHLEQLRIQRERAEEALRQERLTAQKEREERRTTRTSYIDTGE